MQPLIIPAEDITPEITFNPATNQFSIIGESRPENARKFYEPVIQWLRDYFAVIANTNKSPKLVINLSYFNSTSAKIIYDLLAMLKNEGDKFQIQYEIEWHHHELDDDMLDTGKELEKITGLKFSYIAGK